MCRVIGSALIAARGRIPAPMPVGFVLDPECRVMRPDVPSAWHPSNAHARTQKLSLRVHTRFRRMRKTHMSDNETPSELNRVKAEEGREEAEDLREEADQKRDSAEEHRALEESARQEAERFRVLAEEARTLREQYREELESVRQERELLRHAAEEARTAAEEARHATIASVAATAEALRTNLAQMQFLEDARNTVRQLTPKKPTDVQ